MQPSMADKQQLNSITKAKNSSDNTHKHNGQLLAQTTMNMKNYALETSKPL